MSPPVPLTPQAWARIRYEYEHTKRPVDDICVEHGMSAGTLRDRVRRWGWTPRWGAIPAHGPAALVIPRLEYHPPETAADSPEPDMAPLGPRFRGDEREEAWPVSPTAEATPTPTLPLSGGGRSEEPSPHLSDPRPIGERLNGAVARVMPALETTLASLAAGPLAPREMEQAARALGALTRTLRELSVLLAQHRADAPRDIEELRRSVSRKLENMVAAEREATPRRYLAGWEEFAAEAAQHEDAAAVQA